MTKGGEFVPGHDMRRKSQLVAEVQAGGNPDAYEELKGRGWLKALNQSKGGSRPKTAAAFEVGPQHRIDVLIILKAAARRLILSNQYLRNSPNRIEVHVGNMLAIVAEELDGLKPLTEHAYVDTLSEAEREAFERLCEQGV